MDKNGREQQWWQPGGKSQNSAVWVAGLQTEIFTGKVPGLWTVFGAWAWCKMQSNTGSLASSHSLFFTFIVFCYLNLKS
jgi:hypothetical protein